MSAPRSKTRAPRAPKQIRTPLFPRLAVANDGAVYLCAPAEVENDGTIHLLMSTDILPNIGAEERTVICGFRLTAEETDSALRAAAEGVYRASRIVRHLALITSTSTPPNLPIRDQR